MGLFSNKKKEEKNEFGLIGASEWMNEQAKTAKDFNDEDNKMAEQYTPKQARIFIAIEDNEKEGMVAASVKANDKKILLDAFYKLAQHEDSFKELILATAAKLRLVKNISEMTKGMPKELREAIEHLTNIL